jgi:hypothetical protein
VMNPNKLKYRKDTNNFEALVTLWSLNYPIQSFKPHSKLGFCPLPVKLKAAPIALHVFTCTAWDMAQEVGPVCNVSSYLGHQGPQNLRWDACHKHKDQNDHLVWSYCNRPIHKTCIINIIIICCGIFGYG